MATEVIKVDSSKVLVALGRFRLSLQENDELMKQVGMYMLLSVRRTFRSQGVPDNSWVPLSPNTIRKNPKKYGPGHKLLIDKGMLLNSITYRTEAGAVVIGTSLKYAAVHQFGSRDRGGAIGPQARIAGRDVGVNPYSYLTTRHDKSGDKFGKVERYTSSGFKIKGHRRKLVSGINIAQTNVSEHRRFQNIPARPYLVFRPEDPQRIHGIVVRYVNQARERAGLGSAQGGQS
jgi:phage virion morphogenesis protein